MQHPSLYLYVATQVMTLKEADTAIVFMHCLALRWPYKKRKQKGMALTKHSIEAQGWAGHKRRFTSTLPP